MTNERRRSWASYIDRMHALSVMAGVALLTTLTLLVAGSVALRMSMGSGIRGVIEYSEILLVTVAYLSIGVAQREGRHVSITVATSFLALEHQRLVVRIGFLLSLLYVVPMVWEGTAVALDSIARGEARWGLIRVPIWPGRVLLVVGMLMLATELLRQIVVRGDLPALDPTGARPSQGF